MQAISGTTVHSLFLRLFHWLNAVAILLMIGSGWLIYNASPLFPFKFPKFLTLGTWLGGALQLHFAAMWLLMANLLVYLIVGILSGRFRQKFLPLTLTGSFALVRAAVQRKLKHDPGIYNPLQRLSFVVVSAAIALTIASGFAVWKPVQLQTLTNLMGGYNSARYVHFAGMAVIVAFTLMHSAMAILYPSTLRAMITGKHHK